jgi:N-carbamoyl-L-amino-acid hydrolase
MLNRRHFLGTLALSAFGESSAPHVNGARLRRHLEELSVFGRPAGGTFADGVSRFAYSDADIAGRAYVMKLMEAAGLKPRIDAAGNIFGRRAGTQD